MALTRLAELWSDVPAPIVRALAEQRIMPTAAGAMLLADIFRDDDDWKTFKEDIVQAYPEALTKKDADIATVSQAVEAALRPLALHAKTGKIFQTLTEGQLHLYVDT